MGLDRDQPSLLRTIYHSETIVPMPINGVWNAMNKRREQEVLFEDCPDDIRIFHYVDPSRSDEIVHTLSETLKTLAVVSPTLDSRMNGAIESTLATLREDGAAIKQRAKQRIAKHQARNAGKPSFSSWLKRGLGRVAGKHTS